ncbi:MAG: hypothetical protein H0V47_14665 [Chloroflexia bacterium]|nr:hypothetical protein [Chloroflexia bacterium]
MSDQQDTPSNQFEDTAQFSDVTQVSDAAPQADGNPHVAALASDVGPRSPGSSSEGEAAAYLAAALRDIGLPAVRLPAHAPKLSGLQELAFALASLAALLVAVLLPPLGLVLLLGLFGLMLADVYGHVRVSDWLPAGQSVNVLSIVPPMESEVRRLIVTATLDTGQVGILCRKHWGFAYAWLHAVILASQALAVVISVAILARGSDSLAPLFAIPGLMLIVTLALLGEREQNGAHSPGAISNASGIAALIGLAKHTVERPPRWIEVWFLGAGAATFGSAGINDFLKRNTFDPDITYFVHLQSPGGGAPVLPKNTGAGLLGTPATPLLTWIFESASGDLIDTDIRTIKRLPFATQAHATHRAGYQSIVVAGVDAQNRIPLLDDAEDLPYQVHETSIDDTVRFLGAAIEALDREVAARAMLARTAASIQDTTETPVVTEDLPTGDK